MKKALSLLLLGGLASAVRGRACASRTLKSWMVSSLGTRVAGEKALRVYARAWRDKDRGGTAMPSAKHSVVIDRPGTHKVKKANAAPGSTIAATTSEQPAI